MTTDKTSGSSLSPKENLATFEKILSEYTDKVGLKLKLNTEVGAILDLTAEDMTRMTAAQCGEGGFLLYQYAAYIQKEWNRHNVRKMWAEKQLQILLGKYGDQYGDKFTKYDLLMARLIVGDDAAKLLNQILLHAEARATELHDMANRLTMMGRALLDYQNSRNRRNQD